MPVMVRFRGVTGDRAQVAALATVALLMIENA